MTDVHNLVTETDVLDVPTYRPPKPFVGLQWQHFDD
jgi:hypothetical protein